MMQNVGWVIKLKPCLFACSPFCTPNLLKEWCNRQSIMQQKKDSNRIQPCLKRACQTDEIHKRKLH